MNEHNHGKDTMAEKDGGPKYVSDDMWTQYNRRRFSKIGRATQAVSDRIRKVNRWAQEPMNYAVSILIVFFLIFLIYMVDFINTQPDGWTIVWRSITGVDLYTP